MGPGGLVVLAGPGQAFERLVDLLDAFPGGGEFSGVGEWLADAVAGVSDFAMGVVGVGEDGSFAFFQAAEPML